MKKILYTLKKCPRLAGDFIIFFGALLCSRIILNVVALYALVYENLFIPTSTNSGIYEFFQVVSVVFPWIFAVAAAAYWHRGKYGYAYGRAPLDEEGSQIHPTLEDVSVFAPTIPDSLYTQDNDLVITTEKGLSDFYHNYAVLEERRTKVVGVTYRNDDGTDRQTILAHCHAGDEIILRHYKFQGAPAYAVHTEYGQIGNLSAELAEDLEYYGDDNFVSGKITAITGGHSGKCFGCNILLTIYGPSPNR